VKAAHQLKIYPHILEFYQYNNMKLNKHTIKIIKNFIDCPSIPIKLILRYRITDQTIGIIEQMIQNKQDWGFEFMLSALQAIIKRIDQLYLEYKNDQIEPGIDIETELRKIAESSYISIELLTSDSEEVVERASNCLAAVLKKFGDYMGKQVYLQEDQFDIMKSCLQSQNSMIKTRVMYSLSWYLTNAGKKIL